MHGQQNIMKNPLFFHILSQINPVHTVTSSFFKIHSNFYWYTLVSEVDLSFQDFGIKILVQFPSLLNLLSVTVRFTKYYFIKTQITQLLKIKCPPFSSHFHTFSFICSPSHAVLSYHQSITFLY